jgi:hypothetical protein
MKKYCLSFLFVFCSLLGNAFGNAHPVFVCRTPVDEDCCICLTNMNNDSPKYSLTCCGKAIHQACLTPILETDNPKCPLCSAEISLFINSAQTQQHVIVEQEPQSTSHDLIQDLQCDSLFFILQHLKKPFLKSQHEDRFRNSSTEFDTAVQICIKRILREKLGDEYTETTYDEYEKITRFWGSKFSNNLEKAWDLYQRYRDQYFQELILFEILPAQG